jgi:hypothetical protein
MIITAFRTRVNNPPIHFLHIGKNAGTQIKSLCDQLNTLQGRSSAGFRELIKHGHSTVLAALPKGAQYFFSIREPVSRFKSGFYSRKRKGQPRLYAEWTQHEEAAFSDFPEANDLAESLFEGGALGAAAFRAIKSIRHTAQNQSDWFCTMGNFLRTNPPIWIIRQEHFASDFQVLLRRAAFDIDVNELTISANPKTAHTFDYTGVPELSGKAVENLQIWYAQDIQFYAACEEWIDNELGACEDLVVPAASKAGQRAGTAAAGDHAPGCLA